MRETTGSAPRTTTAWRQLRVRLTRWLRTRLSAHSPVDWALRLALAALYILGWSALSQIHLQTSDLERFYIPAAMIALHGRPLFIYSASHLRDYPLANGPLSVAPLVAALAMAAWLGWLRSMALTRLVIVMVYSVFPLLLAREAVRVVDRHAPAPLRGPRRLLVYEVFLISLQLWQSMLYYGHVEQPMMLWLALVGVRLIGEGKPRRAGVWLALALLTRTTALTIIIPVALLLIARTDWRALRDFCVTLALVVAGGLAPFALADGRDLLYSLVTFHNSEAVNGGNVWTLVSGTTLAVIPQRADGVAVVVATVAVAALILRVRPDLRGVSREFYGLLALCSLCHPAFINIVWPYYFLEAFTFCAIWWLAGIGALANPRERTRWLLWSAAPIGLTLLGQARQYALAQQIAATPGSAPTIAAWNLITCCALIAVMATLAWRLERTSYRGG
ncbi:MAG TPA: hypothetical protein VFN78_08835 [Ktedonobacterales bacterium]|nr:hypothetical protein [Ktedonobacterales bacterium]